ncbi:TlpA disulfide reductase family protein [Pedobacter aquatilis]|uniref:TlpA family protein disulfide reductase n=1 Tax=Pedobacter aquatilis TaxID=351343 RepID=UPI00292F3F5E|nr:TlpA disulfide reductase family protein [Pedobacter aquatilis]
MKLFSLITLFFCWGVVNAQTKIQISTKNPLQLKIDRVEVFDLSQKEFYELNYSDSLTFSFEKSNIDCYNIRYIIGKKTLREQIWLNPGNPKVLVHLDSAKVTVDTVLNSASYNEHANFKRVYKELLQKKDTVQLNQILLESFRRNLDNPFSLLYGDLYLNINQNSKIQLLKLKPLLQSQGDKFKWFVLYSGVVNRFHTLLTQNNIELAGYSFYDQQNKITKIAPKTSAFIVLDFWFLTCIPCLKDHKEIAKNISEINKRNAEFISISIDSDLQKWKNYIKSNNYTWRNYLQIKPVTITNDFNISSYPTYIILNRAGEIMSINNSFTEVMNWLTNVKKD